MRLLKAVDDEGELFIFCDNGKVTKLKDHSINLDKLLDVINNHGGCCLDSEDDIIQFLAACVEDSELIEGR